MTQLGLIGASFGSDAPQPLDDAAMDVLYAEAVRLNVPLFIHPGPAGIDGPTGDSALKRFELDIIAGFAAQETLAVATLIYGGVLDRHLGLDICLSHGGGGTALLVGRMAKGLANGPGHPKPCDLRALLSSGLSGFGLIPMWITRRSSRCSRRWLVAITSSLAPTLLDGTSRTLTRRMGQI